MGVWDYPGKYLGLPAEWGRSRSQTLNWLKLRVLDKIDGWKEKLLNQAGKNVLIKSVLQAIPSYAMAIIRFPSSFCKSISSHIARFWWRRPGKERGIHWKVWNFISKAKGKGGLGFKDFSLMNTALLAKQAWRAYKNPSSLWVLVLQGLYYPQTNFLQAKCRRGASWGWRSLVQGRDFLLEHGRWLVGTGKKINVWNDKWIGNELIPMPVGSKPCLTVNSLLAESQIAWDSHKLLSLLPRHEALQALRIPISILGEEDQFCWPHARDGNYSVKTGYQLAHAKSHLNNSTTGQDPDDDSSRLWHSIWNPPTPEKIKVFIWKCCFGAFPIREALHRRRLTNDLSCPICNQGPETILHAITQCPWTIPVWFGSHLQVDTTGASNQSFDQWFQSMVSRLNQPGEPLTSGIRSLAHTIWEVWKDRNECVFNSRSPNPSATLTRFNLVLSEPSEARDDNVPPWNRANRQESARWSPPGPGQLKFNVDATFQQQTKHGVLAVVVRDERGGTVLTHTKRLVTTSPIAAEALAVREALILAHNLNMERVIIESDNQGLVKLIQERRSQWELAPILWDIQRLRNLVDCLGVQWTPR